METLTYQFLHNIYIMLPRVQSYKRKENMLTHYNLDNLMVQCLSGTYFNLIQYMHPRININKNVENIYFMMLIVMLNSSYDYITDKFDKHKMTPKFIENILDITCVLGQYNLFKYYLPDDISNIDIRKQIYLLNYHVQWGNGYLFQIVKDGKEMIHRLLCVKNYIPNYGKEHVYTGEYEYEYYPYTNNIQILSLYELCAMFMDDFYDERLLLRCDRLDIYSLKKYMNTDRCLTKIKFLELPLHKLILNPCMLYANEYSNNRNTYLKLNKVIIHSLSLRGLQYVTKTDEKILSTKKCSMYACTKYMYEAQTIMNTTQENTSCIYQIYDDFKIYICDIEDSDDDV